MSEFEFIAVFVSIVFGLSLTQILSGAVAQVQNRSLRVNQMGWTLFVLYVLALNWWTFFPWSKNESWTFGEFAVIMLWALGHYAMASALYPSRSLDGYSFEERRPLVIWAFLFAAAADAAQTAAQGMLFEPWYYLPFVLYLMGTATLGLMTQSETMHRLIPWVLIVSMAVWSLVVRWVL